jgi:tryptophan halogenase
LPEARIEGPVRVVIAGGGTAGWLAATALARQLGPLIDVVLVESDEIGTVGVGESTIPTTRTFHHLLAIDEREFLCATRSSFKLGISFEDWGDVGEHYFHAFGVTGKSTWMGDFQHFWLEGRRQGLAGDFGDYCFELQAAKAGKFYAGEDGRLSYAYHLEASLYARYLRGLTEAAGVRRVEGRIGQVRQHPETGFVEALVLESGTEVEGDLFIDCTGFRGLLIEQTLKAGFEDWGHWLPADSALAVQTRSVGPARPYTRAIAHSAGWQWQIPLQHRVGNGFVYARDHLSDDEAHRGLLERLEGELITEPRLIRFRAGRRRKVWDRNCIALGLASGFVEPLESTSIHLIMVALTRLIQMFPFAGINPALVDRFNDQSRRELEGIRDFIVLHYHLTRRDDSDFWRRCRTMDIPDTLAHRLALFRDNALAFQASDELFRIDSWVQVMLGQGLMPESYHPLARLMRPDQLERALNGIRTSIERAVAKLPEHQAFLDGWCPPDEAA